MEHFIPVMIFVTVLLLTESVYYLYRERQLRSPSRIRERLHSALNEQERGPDNSFSSELLKLRFKSEIPTLHQVFSKFTIFEALENFLIQANCKWTVGRFFLTSLFLATAAWLPADHFLGGQVWGGWIGSLVAGSLPTIVLYFRKRDRERAFNEQLPDVLDLMARALRAGHSIPAAINFAGQESPEPAGPEFRRLFEEINFGMDIPAALRNLTKRVDCYDLRYLVTAITIQRETGGNLSELFDRLAYLIRERFKLMGQTRALTAEGRLSGHILTALPVVMGGMLYMIQPSYLMILLKDPMGIKILAGAVVMQIIGFLVIRKIVNIETL
jgi:tight adherence protein B